MTTETPTNSTKADGGAKPRSEAGSAGTENLDAILAEFETRRTETKPDVLKDLGPVVEFAKSAMTERATERLNSDIKAAIAFVKEADEVKAAPDKLIRGLLEAKAAEDSSFRQAFENRGKDPSGWKAKLAEARTDAVETVKGLSGGGGQNISSDIAAAKAAVSGESRNSGDAEAPFDAAKWARAPEHEWQAEVRRLKAAQNRR